MHCFIQTKKGNNISKKAFLDVYYAFFLTNTKLKKIKYKARQQEIDTCSNRQVKEQKYYVFKLLEEAVKKSLGQKLNDLNIEKNEFKKWVCKDCYFSLTHTENLVAVAISSAPVGVDVENKNKIFSDRLAQKVFTDDELKEFKQLNASDKKEYFLTKWTQKESVFKSKNERVFLPNKVQTLGAKSTIIAYENKEFILSYYSQDNIELNSFQNLTKGGEYEN